MTLDDAKAEAVIAANRVVFDWCVQKLCSCATSGEDENAMRWGTIAAGFASSNAGYTGFLTSHELEESLLNVAARIEAKPWTSRSERPRPRFLHVFTEAYALYGHTKMCRMWIGMDKGRHEHNVVLLDHPNEVPANLAKVVSSCGGGRVIKLDVNQPLVERARQLRGLARELADVVVLHTHMHDVIAFVAFGVDDGPPVVLVNHADHLFWVGARIADTVAVIRESGREWTNRCRGVQRTSHLPIPLELENRPQVSDAELATEKGRARVSLGIPADAEVFLTVGTSYKYEPIGGVDFLQAAGELLAKRSKAFLLVIGPEQVGRWNDLSGIHSGRLKMVGAVERTLIHDRAADVYLEGFPVGSLTALLEAGAAGLPCVRAPAIVPLPFASDGVALDQLTRPESIQTYVQKAISYVTEPERRIAEGRRLQASIAEWHIGDGWVGRLDSLLSGLPKEHKVHETGSCSGVDTSQSEYWLRHARRGRAPEDVIWSLNELLRSAQNRGFGNSIHLDDDLIVALEPHWKVLLGDPIKVRDALAAYWILEASTARSEFDGHRVRRALWRAFRCKPASVFRTSHIGAMIESFVGNKAYSALRRMRSALASSRK